MVKDLLVRDETYMGYSFWLAERILLYAPSHPKWPIEPQSHISLP